MSADIERLLVHHAQETGLVRRWRAEPRDAFTVVLVGRENAPLKLTTREAKLVCVVLDAAEEHAQLARCAFTNWGERCVLKEGHDGDHQREDGATSRSLP